MTVRKKVNEKHPDFQEYRDKCYAIRDKYLPMISAIEKEGMKKYQNWDRLDCPWDDDVRPIHKQFNDALKKLQNEYSYLFTVEAETDD